MQNVYIQKILTFLEENKLSKTKFCKRSNICLNTLNKVLSGNTKISVIIFLRIADAMKVKLSELFKK